MTKITKVAGVLRFQIHQFIMNYKNTVVLVLVCIFIWSNTQQVTDFAKMVSIKIHPWLFPHFINDYICQFVFSAAIIALFCDAPWDNDLSTYTLVRTGKRVQCVGHLIYILTLSGVFTLFIYIISVVTMLPSVEFKNNWGRVIGTLARTDASAQIMLSFNVNDFIIGAYTPMKATLYSFLLEWACFMWLGTLLYTLNRHIGKNIGTYISSCFVLLDITIANDWLPSAYRFSPITLAQLSSFIGMNKRYGVTLTYAIYFFLISIIILCTISLLLSRRKRLWITW
ncbi:MAG: hypothetical protein LBD23_03320 [Oscillospiraceae bacterium]|jgi:hypothetical protein|nr:hypothetical protein [Oscillospiraceae bacterium]